MQKRYCSCGQQILVSFNFTETSWRVIFYGAHRARRQYAQTHACPACGAPLHIDRIR